MWYGILDRDVRRRIRDAILLSTQTMTLASVFSLAERIELNIMEKRVVTTRFSRDSTTSCGQQEHIIGYARRGGASSARRGE